jgi:DNA-directed RNA polymerase subunit beta'
VLKGTVGNLLVDDALPEPMRGQGAVLDKKGAGTLLSTLARDHPEQYASTLKKLMDLGLQTAYWTGGQSFGLRHLSTPKAARDLREKLKREVEAIWNNGRLSESEKDRRVVDKTQEYQDLLEKTVYDASVEEDNPLGHQVASGSRGNKSNLRSLRGADLLYVDHRNEPIAVPVLRSYSEGLRPHEYFAGSYGSRSGLVASKLSVADSGAFAKQLNQLSHRLLVTSKDADEHDGSLRGLPVDTNDSHNEGAALAHDVGGYPRNTLLTPRILSQLQDKGHKRILVRSPSVGGPPDGGVYGMDVGMREKGRVASVGDFVGISAGQALSQGLTQSSLASKHVGGVSGANKTATGFGAINNLIQVPKTFQGGAAHAQRDGRVQSVDEAPQGGLYVTVDGHKHHVAHGLEATVKSGDEVEAGDILSQGLPNPAQIVAHKGIGEGRRYFAELMRKVYKDSGVNVHRRNVELIARGLIDHVQLTDEHGHHVPGDTVSYSRLEHNWEPRKGHKELDPREAKGMYLEKPILHYTLGTKIRPSVIRNLQEFGVKKIVTHEEPPPFEPEMVRALENLSHDPDVFTRFLGAYGKKNFLRGVHRGDYSDERGTSYVPSLARGVDFNKYPPVKGWEPEKLNTTPPKKVSILDGIGGRP